MSEFRIFAVVSVLLLAACGGAELDVSGDAGITDDDAAIAQDGGSASGDSGTSGPNSGVPDSGSVDSGSPDSGDDMSPDAGADPPGPTRYSPDALRSAVTMSVVDNLRGIRSASAGPDDTRFIKVGASGTVNSNFLDCLDQPAVALGSYEPLRPTVTHFDGAWERDTLAAMVGRTASWVQTGSPSPLEQEIAALNPRIALVNYGTNDMQQGITHQTALWPFWDNMWSLLTGLIADGVIPVVTGLNPRSDSVEAAYWVPTYNEVTRAMAQTLQVPYIDLYNAVVGLNDLGLIADGIHGNASPDGACRFDQAGLAYNYNVRNLLTLQTLDTVRTTVLEGAATTERARLSWSGTGTAGDPVVIDSVPFSHDDTTSNAPTDAFDAYPSCDSGQNESGPERIYQLTLTQPTRLRAMVFDAEADIDIHHLEGDLDPSACQARDDKIVQGTFAAGTHYFVLDTFVSSSSGERDGNFTFVVVRCEAGDSSCD